MTRIHLVGAYTTHNYGDRLYPMVLDRLLAEVGIDSATYFAPEAGSVAGRVIHSTADRDPATADAVLVGGGDLIRTDRRVMAMDALCVESGRRRNVGERARAIGHVATHMRGGPAPWLPRGGWQAPTGLVSVGVHPVRHRRSLRAALRDVRAVWVRSHEGARRLEDVGLDPSMITTGPDAVFGLPGFSDEATLNAQGRDILRRCAGTSHPVAVLQAAPFTGWGATEMARLATELDGMPRVFLPLGGYAGEDRTLAAAAGLTGVPCLAGLEPADITAVLSAAGCLVTTSMHAAIVAAGFRRPVVIPGVAKVAEAFAACPERPPLHAVAADEVALTVKRHLGSEAPFEAEENAAAVRRCLGRVVETLDLTKR